MAMTIIADCIKPNGTGVGLADYFVIDVDVLIKKLGYDIARKIQDLIKKVSDEKYYVLPGSKSYAQDIYVKMIFSEFAEQKKQEERGVSEKDWVVVHNIEKKVPKECFVSRWEVFNEASGRRFACSSQEDARWLRDVLVEKEEE